MVDFTSANLTLFASNLIEIARKPENIIFFEAAKIYLQAA